MLAAVWLAQGYDSEELRELAGLTRHDSRQEGRLLLPGVLASLGCHFGTRTMPGKSFRGWVTGLGSRGRAMRWTAWLPPTAHQ
jgi:hypothetical protein